MVLGFLLLGWIGGFIAAMVHLTTQNGTWAEAFGVFYVSALVIMLAAACLHAARAALQERRDHARALAAPVYAMAPRGARARSTVAERARRPLPR